MRYGFKRADRTKKERRPIFYVSPASILLKKILQLQISKHFRSVWKQSTETTLSKQFELCCHYNLEYFNKICFQSASCLTSYVFYLKISQNHAFNFNESGIPSTMCFSATIKCSKWTPKILNCKYEYILVYRNTRHSQSGIYKTFVFYFAEERFH